MPSSIGPPNQPDLFADTVERLIADPAERARLGRNGRTYVEQHAGRAAAARAYGELMTGQFRACFPEYRDSRRYVMLAAADTSPAPRERTLHQGVCIARIHEPVFDRDFPEGLQRRTADGNHHQAACRSPR